MNRRREKSGCCLFEFFKVVVFTIIAIIVILYFISTRETKLPEIKSDIVIPTATPANGTVAPTATPETPETDGIRGSNAYDVIVDLEKNYGFTFSDMKHTADGYMWDGRCDENGSLYTVMIIADDSRNANYAIKYVYFTFFGNDDGFMKFGTTLPFTEMNTVESAKCVSDLKKECRIDVGDAIFYYSPVGDNGGMLEIASSKCANYIMGLIEDE